MTRQETIIKNLQDGIVMPAMPLALNEDRTFNEKRQRLLVNYYMNAGVGGLAVGVHTTQFAIRDPKINLYETVLKVCVSQIEQFEKETNKTIFKCAGVCGETEQAVKEAKLAKSYGYDAVLLSPGGLQKFDEDYMLERAKRVADVLPVVGFYLQPVAGGRLFTYNFWRQFAEIENVIAIKSAPFNRYQTLDVMRAVASSSRYDKIALYTGNDDNIVIDLLTKYSFNVNGEIRTVRCVGGLLGHWCVWTKKVVEMLEMLKQFRDYEYIPSSLLSLAVEVTDANAAFFDTANNFKGCIAGVHEVLKRQGLMEGIWCLDPEETLSPGQSEEIDRIYKMYPHLNDDDFVKENISKW